MHLSGNKNRLVHSLHHSGRGRYPASQYHGAYSHASGEHPGFGSGKVWQTVRTRWLGYSGCGAVCEVRQSVRQSSELDGRAGTRSGEVNGGTSRLRELRKDGCSSQQRIV